MALICACDESALPTQVDVTCPEDMDQIVKMAFQKPQTTAPFTTADPIDEAASWTALATATDDTKVVFSPALANVIIPASEGVYVGENSNESTNGLGYYVGDNNIQITAEIVGAPQAVATALGKLSCYTDTTLGASNLTMFPFLRRIKGVSRVAAKSETTADSYSGFEIFNFRVSSLDNQGLNTRTKHIISFSMQPDEWEKLKLVSLKFNPLALANV